MVLTILLYGSQTWITYSSHIRLPECFSPALSPHHPQHSLESLCHKRLSFEASCDPQHWSHATEVPSPMGRICVQNGGPSFTMNCLVWRTIHWPQRERSPMECYKYCVKKSLTAYHVGHRCWSVLAADRDAWRHAIFKAVNEVEGDRRDVHTGNRRSSHLKRHTIRYLHPWTLLTVRPFPHRTRQS